MLRLGLPFSLPFLCNLESGLSLPMGCFPRGEASRGGGGGRIIGGEYKKKPSSSSSSVICDLRRKRPQARRSKKEQCVVERRSDDESSDAMEGNSELVSCKKRSQVSCGLISQASCFLFANAFARFFSCCDQVDQLVATRLRRFLLLLTSHEGPPHTLR